MIRIACTENGLVKGLPAADPRITSFRGIPYAAKPINENRWRAPQPCENWEGTLEAYQFAPISVQDTPGIGDVIYNREWHVDTEIPISEDCLYLNVWTNAKSIDAKLPVLVWFFGGAFQWGYTAEMEFDGERLARHDAVVVTVNYRLNVFGFLSHPQITKNQPDAPANFGLLDQQAGIKWVIRNIANFGGDPNNITIAGQSAGGGSVMAHLTSPQSKGLFQKAIVHSALIRSPYPNAPTLAPEDISLAEEDGVKFFEFLGVNSLEEARKLDAFYIRDKYAEYAQSNPRMMIVKDNVFCVGDPLYLFAQGKYPDIPIMTGNTSDEFPCLLFAKDEAELESVAKDVFKEDADAFLSMKEAHVKAFDGAYAPINGLEPITRYLLTQHDKQNFKSPVYYYQFNGEIPGDDHPGTFHSVDLWFFWDTLYKCIRPFQGRSFDLARRMSTYLTNFIKNGDPNGYDNDNSPLLDWTPFTEKNPSAIVFCSDQPDYLKSNVSDFTALITKHTGRTLAETATLPNRSII